MLATQRADDITQVENRSKMKIQHFHLSIVKDGWIGKRGVLLLKIFAKLCMVTETQVVLCSRWFKSAGGSVFEDFLETLHGHRSVSFEVMRTM